MSISFGSDNHSGIHPALLESMVEVNQGHCASYEQDEHSQKLKKLLKEEFSAVESFMVFNGTAANVLSLQACLRSYQSLLCTDISHFNVDECGAPEKIVGCKLLPVKSKNGKFIFSELEKHIIRKGDQHFSQCKALSLTQPTEYGTIYTWEEMQALKDFAKSNDLFIHMDGARLANAAASLNCSFKDLTKDIDILSFGGAKNGLLAGEMVIVRNPNLCEGLKFMRKQSLQLPSKTRFFAAPFLRYFKNQLWREIAGHENTMAQYLHEELQKIPGVHITQKTEANAIFAQLPQRVIKPLRKKFFFYVWDEKTFEVRLMTSFDTQKEHINQFTDELKNLMES